jgi:YD repeat-containing protein
LQQAYTPDGLLASITDANNHTTSFAYDGLDRLATTTYPLGSTETFTYDADNNVLTRKTRANQTISFAYDTLNRLKTKTPPSPATAVNYGYDLNDRPTSISDGSAAIAAAVPPSGRSNTPPTPPTMPQPADRHLLDPGTYCRGAIRGQRDIRAQLQQDQPAHRPDRDRQQLVQLSGRDAEHCELHGECAQSIHRGGRGEPQL